MPVMPPSISRVGAAASVPSPHDPSQGVEPAWSLDVNALAFSKMSVLQRKSDDTEALIAVPSLTKDELVSLVFGTEFLKQVGDAAPALTFNQVDVFTVPSSGRVHRSIGAGAFAIGEKTGELTRVICGER
jgi:hypothetical protein